MKNKQYSWPKKIGLLFISIGIFFLGASIFFSLKEFSLLENQSFIVFFAFLISLVFFGLGALHLHYSKFPFLAISHDGIIIGKNIFSKERSFIHIPWKHILKVESKKEKKSNPRAEHTFLTLTINPFADINGASYSKLIQADSASGIYKIQSSLLKPDTIETVIRKIEKAKITYEKWGII